MTGFHHLDRLPAAVYGFAVGDAVNLGGDSGTIGALAGGVAGILYGKESISDEWLDMLRGRDIIDTVLDHAGARPRPEATEAELSENKPDATPRTPLMQRLLGTLFGKER